MKYPTRNKAFYLLGKCLGQPLAWVLRQQRPLIHWLTTKGLPVKLASLLMIAANLLVLTGILLFFIPIKFIILVVFVLIIAYSGADIEIPQPKQPEWRMGVDGYGLYNDLGIRLDGSSEDDV